MRVADQYDGSLGLNALRDITYVSLANYSLQSHHRAS